MIYIKYINTKNIIELLDSNIDEKNIIQNIIKFIDCLIEKCEI